MTSLQDFAAIQAELKQTRCRTCNLPEELRTQVEAGFLSGQVTLQVISNWLETMGHQIPGATIHNHFSRGHVKKSEASA